MVDEHGEMTTDEGQIIEGESQFPDPNLEIVEPRPAQETEGEVQEEQQIKEAAEPEVEQEAEAQVPDDQWSGDYDKLKGSYENLRVYANRLKQESDLRFAKIDGRLEQINQQPKPDDVRPEDMFEEGVKNNPYEAVRTVAEKQAQAATRANEDRLARIEEQQRYNNLEKSQNQLRQVHEDYNDLMPTMNELYSSGRFKHLINPQNPDAPEYLEFLYYKAREMNKGDLVARAKSKGVKEAIDVQRNKRKAFSESSSKPTETKDFKNLNLKEMEELLGVSKNRTSTV